MNAYTQACHDGHRQHVYGIKGELAAGGLVTFRDRTDGLPRLIDAPGARVSASVAVAGLEAAGYTDYRVVSNAISSPDTVGYVRALDAGP
ncbi:MAG: hypothetical protein LBG06_09585 [Deltaproteobacteria bacterium]|jgi:hypothetical protein|nr:hypothetical protein [Deltaproteobacteria bacterium]